MQNYSVNLTCDTSRSYAALRAAQSCDLDVEKKLSHVLQIEADIVTPFSVGLIVGKSGSGKTTLAREMFGKIAGLRYEAKKSLIDNFPSDMSYDEVVRILASCGLSSVPEWLKPIAILSNGERARAEIALSFARNDFSIVDEFTSVLDRDVARVTSHVAQKFVRKAGKSVVFLTPHYDVIDWLLPDWIIDTNKSTYSDFRNVTKERKKKMAFEIRETEKSCWRMFEKYHYLSASLPRGESYCFGLFFNGAQLGVNFFSTLMPGQNNIVHFNRTVVLPEWCGIGLGEKLITETSRIMRRRGKRVLGKFSNSAVAVSLLRSEAWRLVRQSLNLKPARNFMRGTRPGRASTLRAQEKTFLFEFVGNKYSE